MAYTNRTRSKTRKTTTRGRSSYNNRPTVRGRSSTRRRATSGRPATIKLVIEQVAPGTQTAVVNPMQSRQAGKAVF